MMNYKTAGESHGQGILALIEGFPAGIEIDKSIIDNELRRRQGGFGRGGRQEIETDHVEILTGIWRNISTGAPMTLWIKNRDVRIDTAPDIMEPRPGHADLAGSIKYGIPIRPILERASARETAGRVAAGALARQFLEKQGITILGFVRSLGDCELFSDQNISDPLNIEEIRTRRNQSELYSLAPERDHAAKELIKFAQNNGDTVGGVIEVRVWGVPIGLGSHTQWDQKLDGRLAQAVMSIQAIKGVEIGLGFEAARLPGSKVHDSISWDSSQQGSTNQGFTRQSNNAGGIEGGISNGQPVIVRAAMKPIPTLKAACLGSVNMNTKEPVPAAYERSDVCAVPAASVVLENVVAMEIAKALLEARGM